MTKAKCRHCGKEVDKINLKDHEEEHNIKGIGGWLLFVAIGLYASIIMVLEGIFTIEFLFLKLVLLIQLCFLAYTIYLMHIREKRFKKFAVLTLWLGVALIIIEAAYFSLILTSIQFSYWLGEMTPSFIGTVIGAIIWTAYFNQSKRVENTFVN